MNKDYGYINSYDDEMEDNEIVPVQHPDTLDRGAWENMFHAIPQEQLEVFVFLYLGLSPSEVAEALQYPNIVRFYNVNAKLRKSYREQKERILAYN